MQATEGRIIVQPDDPDEETKGGIVIPVSAQEKCNTGIVIHVGPGEYLESGTRKEEPCKAGDRVLWPKIYGDPFLLDGQEYIVLRYTEVAVVL